MSETANGEHMVPHVDGEVRHIISVNDFNPDLVEVLFDVASEYKEMVHARSDTTTDLNTVDPVVSFFEEPSTRTRFSFEFAAQRLGFKVVTTEAGKVFSSKAKGESISDTAINLEGYQPSAIFGRFSEEGDALEAAKALRHTPLLNGGDGSGEHPTQALLDMFTIDDVFGGLEGHKIVLGGDLANGRTVHSLARSMAKYDGTEFLFVAPDELRMSDDVKNELTASEVTFTETVDVSEAMNWADVVYWTRLQAERIKDEVEKLEMIEKQKSFAIRHAEVQAMKQHAILMHPLPRVAPGFIDSAGHRLEPEIWPEVDNDPRARYFEQSENGMYTRMALLRWALEPRYGRNGTYPPHQYDDRLE